MKKALFFFSLLVTIAGCSNDNKLTVTNYSSGTIHFNFRAQKHTVPIDGTVDIADIPNGTYSYSTTFQLPPGTKSFSMADKAASGDVTLEKMNTQILVIYSGVLLDSVYTFGATITSTNSNSSSTTPTHY